MSQFDATRRLLAAEFAPFGIYIGNEELPRQGDYQQFYVYHGRIRATIGFYPWDDPKVMKERIVETVRTILEFYR